MDFPRTGQIDPPLHPAVRNAFAATGTALVLTLSTTAAVSWVLQTFGYSAAITETFLEAQRWFLPMAVYLWCMFWMIDAGAR